MTKLLSLLFANESDVQNSVSGQGSLVVVFPSVIQELMLHAILIPEEVDPLILDVKKSFTGERHRRRHSDVHRSNFEQRKTNNEPPNVYLLLLQLGDGGDQPNRKALLDDLRERGREG